MEPREIVRMIGGELRRSGEQAHFLPVASVGRVSRGCFTSFYGPPTLEFLRFLALLPSILPTMPAAALMSALGKFRFIGSRPRLCS